MDLQFKLELYTGTTKEHLHMIKMPIFKDNDLKEEMYEQIPSVKEYAPLEIVFESKDSADRILIEDMEDYQLKGQATDSDNGASIFKPSPNKIEVYSEEEQPVPLIPGYYTLIVSHSSINYYSYFRIKPKDLADDEWKQLIFDIENTVSGLASDFVNQRRSNQGVLNVDNSDFLLSKLEYFLKNRTKIRLALEQITNEAKYKVSKKYRWRPKGKVNNIDINSIRKMGERPDKSDQIYAPIHYLEYDVSENRWIKYIVNYFASFCLKGKNYYKNILDQINVEYQKESQFFATREHRSKGRSSNDFDKNRYQSKLTEVTDKLKELNLMYTYFESILHDSFFNSVTGKRTQIVPKTLVLVPKYNIIYRTYLSLIKAKKFVLSDKYHFYWKQTSVLYEIWGYIKVIELLIKSDYHAVSGWVFDEKLNGGILPFLKDETRVILENKSTRLAVVYNQPLPDNINATSIVTPVYTTSRRNKPDIRIDIFTLDNKFKGCLVIDTKYMKLNNILKSQYNGDKTRQQFSAYRDNIQSNMLDIQDFYRVKSVQDVFGVYPGSASANIPTPWRDETIIFNRVTPKNGQDDFIANLLKSISDNDSRYRSLGHKYSK